MELAKKSIETTIIDDRKTLIYCRESRDDNGDNYQAIVTQKKILLDFCERQGLVNIVDIVMDDDMSGTCFKRLQKIMKKIQNGEVEVIVFKDASRLGRNLRDSLNFIHDLEIAGAEIIFESEKYDEDIFPLLAWFNERRAKDDSNKIRRVMKHKMEQGDLITKRLYGYTHPVNNQMDIDPITGPIVKEIYSLFLDGNGTFEIASILNQKQLPTPSQANGLKQVASVWNRQHIWRILSNESYTGKMIYRKRTTISFKNKKTVVNPKQDWIIIENHHPALISKEEFEQVQSMRIHSSKRKRSKQDRPFSGLLQCGRCGCNLILRQRANRNDAYICAKNQREGCIKDHIREGYGCASHHVREDDLYDIVCQYIRGLLKEEEKKVSSIIRSVPEKNQVEKLINELNGKISHFNRIIDSIYEDKLNGVISEQLFTKKYAQYNESLLSATKELTTLEQKKQSSQKPFKKFELKDILKKVSSKAVNSFQLKQLFDKIICYNPGDVSLEDKERYCMTDDFYQMLLNEGGLLFVENTSTSVGLVSQS